MTVWTPARPFNHLIAHRLVWRQNWFSQTECRMAESVPEGYEDREQALVKHTLPVQETLADPKVAERLRN